MSSILIQIRMALGILTQVENWPAYFADHLGLVTAPSFIIRFRNGLKYKLRPHAQDRGVVTEVCIQNVYLPAGFFIKPDAVVFDVGAHIGIFSLLAARSCPQGKVYSFEPNPDNFSLLQENIALNGAKNVIATPKAMADKSGTLTLLSPGPGASGSFSLHYGNAAGSFPVSAVSLEEFMKQNRISKIDFFKMDCEGGEYAILFSASDDILSRIRLLSMEYHNLDEKRNGEALAAFLRAKGFQVLLHPPEPGFFVGMLYAKQG